MAKIGLPKVTGKRLKVREKSVKIQGILKWILSGNPVAYNILMHIICTFEILEHSLYFPPVLFCSLLFKN